MWTERDWCALCAAEKITQRHHEDDLCWVANCATCHQPMVVLRDHRMPTEAERPHLIAQLEAVAHARYGANFYVDPHRRSIPTHWHAHARQGPPENARLVPTRIPDGEPILGWRYWGGMRYEFGQPWLVAPTLVSDAASSLGAPVASLRHALDMPHLPDTTAKASWWTRRAKVAPPCPLPMLMRQHSGPIGETCVCGLFAYKSLEHMALHATACSRPLTLVAGHGPAYWSITDHRASAWRTQVMSLRVIVLPDSSAPERVAAVRDHFGLPVLLGPLDEPWPRRWAHIARWAKAEGLPALWADDTSGPQPEGRRTLPTGRPIRISAHCIADWPPPVRSGRLREVAESGSGTDWLTPETARDAYFCSVDDLDPSLAVGGVATHALDLVAAQGYTHMLDLRETADSADSARRLGLTYRHLPAIDDGKPKPREWFAAGVEFADQAQHDGGRLLIACHRGHNRGPSMSYAVLRARGDSPEDATRKI
ncbi:MAG TPA: hypothetical protein VFM74_02585, partial [Candidatus Limnocylindria bacterium]|nr:hypothetical protein [Candidatus Limnocylindria bacterium]